MLSEAFEERVRTALIADGYTELDIDPDKPSFVESNLWPEDGGFTVLFFGGKDKFEDTEDVLGIDLSILPMEDCAGEFANVESDSILCGYESMSVLDDMSAEERKVFQEQMEEDILVATALMDQTNQTIKMLEGADNPTFTWKLRSLKEFTDIIKDPAKIEEFGIFIEEKYGTKVLDKNIDLFAVLIPSQSLILEARKHGLSFPITSVAFSINSDIEEGTPSADAILDAIDFEMNGAAGEARSLMDSYSEAAEWIKGAVDFSGASAVLANSVEHQAQMKLEF